MFRSQALFNKKAKQAKFSPNRENAVRQTEMYCRWFPLPILYPFMFSFSDTFRTATNSTAVSLCPSFCHPTIFSLTFTTVSQSLLVLGASSWWVSVFLPLILSTGNFPPVSVSSFSQSRFKLSFYTKPSCSPVRNKQHKANSTRCTFLKEHNNHI